MKLYHEEESWVWRLEEAAKHWQYARLLLGDGWRPISEYVYDRNYVYAAGVTQQHAYSLFIGRGGKYETSDWWTPTQREVPVALYVTHWQPLPEGVDPYTHGADLFPPPPDRPAKPPEPVYEACGTDFRLTPVPRKLLVDLAGGAVLKESTMQWTSWQIARPGQDPEKLSARGVEALRAAVFIERVGVLPPGHLSRMHRFDCRVSPAGAAWLAANHGLAKC